MQNMESSEQYRQQVQQLLQRIDEKINDLAGSGYNDNQGVNEENNEAIERLKSQRKNLQEALDRYGNETGDNWMKVKPEAQYALKEVENNWLAGANPAGSMTNNKNTKGINNQEGKWQVSTGQSDRGESGSTTGLGDRAGMEDPQMGLDNETQYSSFGNPYDEDKRATRPQEHADSRKTERQMQANDRQHQHNPDDEDALRKTNRGGDATQDDPGGSADKEDRESNNPSRTREKEPGAAENRPWDSRTM